MLEIWGRQHNETIWAFTSITSIFPEVMYKIIGKVNDIIDTQDVPRNWEAISVYLAEKFSENRDMWTLGRELGTIK